MKKFKFNLLGLLVLFVTMSTFIACNSDEGLSNDIEANKISKSEAKLIELGDDLSVDLRIDKTITKEEAIVFENIEDLRDFIIKTKEGVKNSIIELENTQFEMTFKGCDQVSGVYSGTALTSGFADLNLTVSVENGVVTGTSGAFSGWTLGVGYTQGSHAQGPKGGSITLVTSGTINYSLFWNGVGTFYSEQVSYTITIPC